jgi:glycosyltransferase involved in cell wall biosynthesis
MVGKSLFNNEKMKILMIFLRWPGGVGEVIRSITKEFEDLGHEVRVISREEDLKIFSFIKSIFPLRKKIKELIKKEEFDIIYTHDWSTTFPLLFPYRIKKDRHFCIFYGNQLGPTKIFQEIVGKAMKNNLIIVGDLNKRKFPNAHLIRNAVNMDKFKPLNKKRTYLGWSEKSTESITREEVIRISEKVKLPMLIAKNIPAEKMNEFYNKCKVFISLPPRASAGALSWMEAMAAGVPKIIGNKESESYLFPIERVDDKRDIAKSIIDAKEKDYRKWLTKTDFSWRSHVNKLLNVFSSK